MIPSPAKLVSPDVVRRIQTVTAARYGTTRAEVIGPKKTRVVSQPRNVAMAVTRRMTKCSFPLIGHLFRRDHTTVLLACRKVERQAKIDPDLRAMLLSIEEEVRSR